MSSCIGWSACAVAKFNPDNGRCVLAQKYSPPPPPVPALTPVYKRRRRRDDDDDDDDDDRRRLMSTKRRLLAEIGLGLASSCSTSTYLVPEMASSNGVEDDYVYISGARIVLKG